MAPVVTSRTSPNSVGHILFTSYREDFQTILHDGRGLFWECWDWKVCI